jgi:hypothetical protein
MNYTAILLDRVEKKLAAWSHYQCLGEIFLKLVPHPHRVHCALRPRRSMLTFVVVIFFFN